MLRHCSDLDEQLDLIEKESSVRGVIVTSAKKSIFIAGADLQTLLRTGARPARCAPSLPKASESSIDWRR